VLDLEAVVDQLGLERLDLLGSLPTGPVAVAYAARHPDRISHLILWCTSANPAASWAPSMVRSMFSLAEADWQAFTETFARIGLGWSDDESARRYAAFMRECVTPEVAAAAYRAITTFDVTGLLPQVQSPTLVLHRAQLATVSVDSARELAVRIPDARLVVLQGESGAMQVGDWESVFAAMDGFLSEGEDAEGKAELPEGMAVILFADIVESTALTEEMGDAAFRAKARELDASLRAIIRECAGTPVEGKVLGDGVLAVFTSARQAIECALRCNAASEPAGLRLHLGIHAGDVIREDDPDGRANVYGGAVNIAARIAGASAPGEVLVSDTVRGLARTSAGVAFDDRGERALKGVADPQRLFAVRGGSG
jgi:class 3 adenylate cyclase